MRYTCCERLLWHIIAPASLRCLSEQGKDALALKRKAKTIYRQMVKRIPSIGGLTSNSLHTCLVAGMIRLSIYEAAEGGVSEGCFTGSYAPFPWVSCSTLNFHAQRLV